jgi:hypothetical protein
MGIIQIVIVVFVLLVLLYLIINAFSKTNKLTKMSSAKLLQTIKADSLKNTNNSTNFTYSMWIYVDDWNYNFGNTKTVLSRGGGGPTVVLGGKPNTLTVNIGYYDAGSTGAPAPTIDTSNCAKNAANAQDCLACGNGYACACANCNMELYQATYIPVSSSAPAGTQPTARTLSPPCNSTLPAGAPSSSGSSGSSSNTTSSSCEIDNIPIQAWVNIVISLYGSTLDTYLNGKLVRTCVLPGVPNIDNGKDIEVTPNGGFSGWTTSFKYWANASNPQDAYNIYKAGFGGSILANMINKYRVRFSLIKDNAETDSFGFEL